MGILVIGAASIDRLHFAGRTALVPGGAGLYTALAAAAAGGRVVLLAPRPEPMPQIMQPAAAVLDWIGPSIQADEQPRLEIAHYGDGKAALLRADWGAMPRFRPDDLPAELDYDFVHIAALGPAGRQLAFLRALRARSPARISVGTYARSVFGERAAVRELFERSDLGFLNANEAGGLYGSVEAAEVGPGQSLFVTLGANGAWVVTVKARTHIPGRPAVELDPTGAGDTFCGATLAGLSRGLESEAAARAAVSLAAAMIEQTGPSALLPG